MTSQPALRLAASLALTISLAPAAVSAQTLAVENGAKIAFLGDSITQAGARRPHGYCRLVMRGLGRHGVKAQMVPAGVSGHKSNQMLARLDRDVLQKKPDWMTLSCGVNDVWHGPRGVPLPAYKENITEIVDRCQAAGIRVMILTATMIQEDAGGELNKKLAPYNAFLRQLAKEKKCVLADLDLAMRKALIQGDAKPKGNQLTTDGVHMNTRGNIEMALGVLAGFGLNGEQLAACRKDFEAIPGSCSVRVERRLTAGELRRLQVLAGAKGISVQQLLVPDLDARLRALLGDR